MRLRIIFIFAFLIHLLACQEEPRELKDLTGYVDPMIGTDAHGHTFPGPTSPFGMVQLSPDTGIEGWDWCSGYHYSDSSIIGFSHLHLSGTGGADLGDIMIMPFTGERHWFSGTKEDPDSGYRSRFSHDEEEATAGYYSVLLHDYQVQAELTVTPRTGIHRYRFLDDDEASVIIDLKHGISSQPRACYIEITGENEIRGLRASQGWASDQQVYFVARFSHPIVNHEFMKDDEVVGGASGRVEGRSVKAMLDFGQLDNRELMVKVGISAVDEEGALKNLEAEATHWSFETYLEEVQAQWNKHLNKITIKGATLEQKRTFYTAMYHAQIAPALFTDVDGRYRGMDKNIHTAKDHDVYTIFSLWDTFRAVHPLFTLIAPEKNMEFINTMLLQYQQHGLLPVWELMANETGTMIGYHSVPVIWDAYQKGHRDFDVKLAFEAMKKSAMQDHIGLADYKNLGFIPLEREGNSVSKTVEYAYDDWCIAEMAKSMGRDDDYKTFIKRAQNYRNVFDTSVGFLRGRSADGSWRTPFDPIESSILGSGDFTEGNSWHYTFFAPHDVSGLIELLGGDEAFSDKIDEMIAQEPIVTHEAAHDISGLIGQYAHGNEPSHHVAYLHSYAGRAWKTQEKAALIMDLLYSDQPDGISGNEDCGQLSAWYIFSATGFYPVAPGSGDYIIGSPLFEQTTIHLANGKTFTVKTEGRTRNAFFIQSAQLNGKPFHRSYISHNEIEAGGVLEFVMGLQPNKEWGYAKEHRPKSYIPDEFRLAPLEERLVFIPFISKEKDLFHEPITFEIECLTPGVTINYTTDGSEPTQQSALYEGPITIDETTLIKAKAFREGMQTSETLTREFIRAYYRHSGRPYPAIELQHGPAGRYTGRGKNALLDGQRGTIDFFDGEWLGFMNDLVATVDLGAPRHVESIRLSFMRNVGSWILLPETIEIAVSNDNQHFIVIGTEQHTTTPADYDIGIKAYRFDAQQPFRYARIVARSTEALPEWHPGAGNRPWLFTDEIILEY